MIRSTVAWLVLILFAVFGLYQVKYEVRDVKAGVGALESELEKEYKALHVLQAEWAYLNRPERLARLSAKYLGLQPLSAVQMTDLMALNVLPDMEPEVAAGEALLIPAAGVRYGR